MENITTAPAHTQTDTRTPYRIRIVETQVYYVDLLAETDEEACDLAVENRQLSWEGPSDLDAEAKESLALDFDPFNA